MNYLKQILAFHTWLETNQLDPAEQALWFHLMEINNKCGWTEWFTVANMTLQARLGIDRKTLDRKRTTLINKGRIQYKTQGKRQAGKYSIIAFKDVIAGNIPLETGLFVTNDVPKVSLEMSTLIKQNKTKQKDNKPPTPSKNNYAEFVTMTEAEYQKLLDQYGSDFTTQCIQVLDNYKGAKGTKYKSDYRAILNWVVKRVTEEQGGAIRGSTGQPTGNLRGHPPKDGGTNTQGQGGKFDNIDFSKFYFKGS